MTGTPPATDSAKVTVQWNNVTRVSKTQPSLLVMASNPLLRRGSPIHDQAFRALRDLGADYASHLAWFPYPKLAVAALKPPRDGNTSWDFSLIDPMTLDFLEATQGRPVVLNFSTIPQWMFKTEKPVEYPDDPNQAMWTYSQGTELRDPSLKELSEYYARLASWYMKGGFHDEFGKWHESGHRYEIDTWGVLNEVDLEHSTTPAQYTARYDAIVEAVRRVAPGMKFAGPFLAIPTKLPEFFAYFLDPKNHKPGIPIDWVAYHFYALPTPEQPLEIMQYTVFEQGEKFLDVVRYIEAIRHRFAPQARTLINELGIIWPEDFRQGMPDYVYRPIPEAFRNLFASLFAYLFGELTRLGIDVVAESQLVGHPSQFPSVTMVDWETGRPNATYWALKLIRDNFAPGDRLVETRVEMPRQLWLFPPSVYALAKVSPAGERKVLLVNKRQWPVEVSVAGGVGARTEIVDQTTGLKAPVPVKLDGETFTLGGWGVAVVTLNK